VAHDKQITEHEVREALARPGCAICALNHRAVDGWIQSLLREGITDVKARLRFRDSGGLCGEHTRLLEDRGSPLGVSILLHDLLTQASPASTARRATPRCGACGYLAESEARYLDALAATLVWPDVQTLFAQSEGLCAPHIQRLIRRARRGTEHWIRVTCAQHLEPLVAELAEIIRKHDYRYAAEPWGEEADAWRRAAARYGGECVATER
jgi:hypothetical protein